MIKRLMFKLLLIISIRNAIIQKNLLMEGINMRTPMNRFELEPKKKYSAPDHVISQIEKQLYKKTIAPGDKLPSETELAEMTGVSRGSVRQAMKVLEAMGVVEITPGNGTYVCKSLTKNSFNSLAFSLFLSQPSAKDMADARCRLEIAILDLIISDSDLVGQILPLLEENVEEHKLLFQSGASSEQLAENDMNFHLILSAGCGNHLFSKIYDYVMEFFYYFLVDTTGKQITNEEEKEDTITAHLQIIDAIRSRDYNDVRLAAIDSTQIFYKLLRD